MRRGAQLSVGDISRPENRVLRVTNLHYDATDNDVQALFDGYGLVDWKRDYNSMSGKPSVGYVLMATFQDVNRAQKELDGKELLGRAVRVWRAKAGFQLNEYGLLNHPPPELFSSAPLARTNYLPPYVEDQESRPISPYTPRRQTRTRSEDPQKRVLLVNNLHPEANESAVKLFFSDYNVIAFKRNYNPKTRKPMPLGFVLLATIDERNRAKKQLNGQKLMGRAVEIEWGNKGIKVNEAGFVLYDAEATPSPGRSGGGHGDADTVTAPHVYEPTYTAPRPQKFRHWTVGELPAASYLEEVQYAAEPEPTNDFPEAPLLQWGIAEPKETEDGHGRSPSVGCRDGAQQAQHAYQAQEVFTQPPPREILDRSIAQEQAQYIPRPWNIAGHDSMDRRVNIITEQDWYWWWKEQEQRYR